MCVLRLVTHLVVMEKVPPGVHLVDWQRLVEDKQHPPNPE